MSSPGPDVLDRLEREVTEELLEHLTFYALGETRRKWWRGVLNGHLPDGKVAQDIVAEAVHDVVLGGRAWQPTEHPDLFKFLCDVIDSKVSHLVYSAENRKDRLAPGETVEETVSFLDAVAEKQEPSADQILQKKEIEAKNDALFSQLIEFFNGDPLVQGILGCNLEGVEKRAEIAQELGVTEQEITNARKRMERKLPEFRLKHAHLNPFLQP